MCSNWSKDVWGNVLHSACGKAACKIDGKRPMIILLACSQSASAASGLSKSKLYIMNLILTVLILVPQSNPAFWCNIMLTMMMTMMKQVIWRRSNMRMSSQEYWCLYSVSKRIGLEMYWKSGKAKHAVPWDACNRICTHRHTHTSKFTCALYYMRKIIAFSLCFVIIIYFP